MTECFRLSVFFHCRLDRDRGFGGAIRGAEEHSPQRFGLLVPRTMCRGGDTGSGGEMGL